jgi:hypothetical protein
MYWLLNITQPKAKKRHRCAWCGESIDKNEYYVREISIYDGEFQNHPWHNECWEDCKEHCDGEFSLCENERPEIRLDRFEILL